MICKRLQLFVLLTLCVLLQACVDTQLSRYPIYAPVVEGTHLMQPKFSTVRAKTKVAPNVQPMVLLTTPTYTVSYGDTLYSVAWRYHLDYRTLAEMNKITAPYSIYPGQTLQLRQSKVASQTIPTVTHTQLNWTAPQKAASNHWSWPTQGELMRTFSENSKGLDITGHLGQPIKASQEGEVVYSGRGLRGYGSLIILKHNDEYLSAYAHNQRLLVKEGEQVKGGQVIATMGRYGATKAGLHFEIRRKGTPINPLTYLARGEKLRLHSYVG